MRRRDFITLFAGAAVPWPRAALAQQPSSKRRIGILQSQAESDPGPRAQLMALAARFQELGCTEGQ